MEISVFRIYRIVYFCLLGIYFLSTLLFLLPKIKQYYRIYYRVPKGAKVYLRELLEPKFRSSLKKGLKESRFLIGIVGILLLILGILSFFV